MNTCSICSHETYKNIHHQKLNTKGLRNAKERIRTANLEGGGLMYRGLGHSGSHVILVVYPSPPA